MSPKRERIDHQTLSYQIPQTAGRLISPGCHYLSGLASEDQLAAYFAKLKERDEKHRQEQERREAET